MVCEGAGGAFGVSAVDVVLAVELVAVAGVADWLFGGGGGGGGAEVERAPAVAPGDEVGAEAATIDESRTDPGCCCCCCWPWLEGGRELLLLVFVEETAIVFYFFIKVKRKIDKDVSIKCNALT